MPEIVRTPTRLDCNGVDLTHPVDRMPAGNFPYLQNARVLEEGRLDSRPGYVNEWPNIGQKHSIRRLNDEDLSLAPNGYIDIVGQGTELWAGPDSTLTQIATGFSGDPLSLITFRPDQSPESWMYVYDRQKLVKVRPDKTVKSIGVPPPGPVTLADYGVPALVSISDGQVTTGWTATGAAGAITAPTRWGAITITSILYNSGTTGWCLINPSASLTVAERARCILNAGGGNAETVVIREIHPAITSTTIQAIDYDAGTTGACSIVLTGSPVGLTHNSLLSLNTGGGNAEIVRVMSVNLSPDGSTYSLRCSTVNTHVAAEVVDGLISWYVYTTVNHVPTETITSKCVFVAVPTITSVNTSAAISLLGNIDASKANGRPVSLADDYMHISFWATTAPNVVALNLWIDIDSLTTTLTPGAGGAFQNNYIKWTLTPAQIFGELIPTVGSWNELTIPLAEGLRAGDDPTRTLADIKAIRIEVICSDQPCDFAFAYWYFFGTFGPFVQPNSPVGLLYESRDRDSNTGAASVPGPQTRFELFPLREEVLITPQATTAAEVDSLDIFRQGGTLTDFTYVGTVANNSGSPNTFHDDLPDTSVLSNPVADLTLLQPWPVQDLPWAGTVNVVGTTVRWVSGSKFNTALLSAQVILINGIAYQTYGQPHSTTFLEIFDSGGVQGAATFQIASPTLAGQPLPFAFGPLEGPFSPVVFALGDAINTGLLYYTNFSDADSASDKNTLEICPPSEPLVSGAVWNGIVIVGSRDNIYLVRYSFLQSTGISFQFQRLPSPSGMWSRWACCRGQDGIYFLGRDGIYRATDSGVESITDHRLYPIFPHDGQPAAGNYDLKPVDMSKLTLLRLNAADEDVYFDYPEVVS